MKTITLKTYRVTYSAPSTRTIEISTFGVLMNSFETRGSQTEELDELGTTSTGVITWN